MSASSNHSSDAFGCAYDAKCLG